MGTPPIHAWVSDRAWTQDGVSSPLGGIDSAVLTLLVQQNVLDIRVAQRRLSRPLAQPLRSWQHSGFQVYGGRLYSTPQLGGAAAA